MSPLRKHISSLSIARWYDPFVNIVVAILSVIYFSTLGISDSYTVLYVVLSVSLVAFVIECLRAEWFKKYLIQREKLPSKERFFWQSVFTKWLGVLTGVGLVLFLLWLLPDYRLPKYAQPLLEVKYFVAGLILALSFLLITLTNRILGSVEDATFALGQIWLKGYKSLEFKKIKDAVLEWILRSFFLVMNYTTAVSLFTKLKVVSISTLVQTPLSQSITTWLDLLFLILLFTILPGYLFSARLINTQVRDLDRTLFGWVVTFICYPPVIYSVFGAWLEYRVNIVQLGTDPWIGVLQSMPLWFGIISAIIIFSEIIHLWGEAILGIRSSNLMNRGIVTNGPFAYTKHPIYVVKCIGWFFIFLPFMTPVGFWPTIQTCILFLMVCGVFTARSWAEERLLAKDEVYVAYAKFIDSTGIFKHIGKYIPLMSFAWRYDYWQKNGLLEK
jgi:isoprenylcysteine carboxyl methyltransferase (ICMT) family protein YpbQ